MKKEDRTVSFEALQRQKRRARARDARRLAAGEVTPEQLQEENSFIPSGTPMVVNWEAYFRSRRSK